MSISRRAVEQHIAVVVRGNIEQLSGRIGNSGQRKGMIYWENKE